MGSVGNLLNVKHTGTNGLVSFSPLDTLELPGKKDLKCGIVFIRLSWDIFLVND